MSQRETGLIKTVFNTDNLVMRISEKIADLVTVNLLFVLSCLPIVTIGIAKISLYQTVLPSNTNVAYQSFGPTSAPFAKIGSWAFSSEG